MDHQGLASDRNDLIERKLHDAKWLRETSGSLDEFGHVALWQLFASGDAIAFREMLLRAFEKTAREEAETEVEAAFL